MSEPAYFLGWDEETVYLRRDAYPTAEAARAEFLRLSIDEFGFTNDEVEGIEAAKNTVPCHESESPRCYHNECDCPEVDVWEFAP